MTLFWLVYSRLADHCLELKRSTRETGDKNAAEKSKADLGKACTKILVRNIPFQVRILSSDWLTLKMLSSDWFRLPRKRSCRCSVRLVSCQQWGFLRRWLVMVTTEDSRLLSSPVSATPSPRSRVLFTVLTCMVGDWCWSGRRWEYWILIGWHE